MGLRITSETQKGTSTSGGSPSMRRYQRLQYARRMGREPPADIVYETLDACLVRAGL